MLQSQIIELIAKVAHNTNRAYCESIGDSSQPSWEDAPVWQKVSAISGVKFHIKHNHTPEESHENWCTDKIADGWVRGDVKDPDAKTHPCLVPYNELPTEQRTKDYLFKSVVDSFKTTYVFNREEL